MSKKRICVIFGGMSTEHSISNISGTSVIKNLDKSKYDILPIYIDKEGNWYEYIKDVNEIDILKVDEEPVELKKIEKKMDALDDIDVVFPVLHGLYGEDGSIQGMLEFLNKKYVGCDIISSAVCMNKIYTKILFEKAGINQAKSVNINVIDNNYVYIDDNMNFNETNIDELDKIVDTKLKYPVFIKPSNSGSSVGVNKANNKEELEKYLIEASKYDKEILIEEQIIGKEVECAVLGNEFVKVSSVGEIVPANEFYDFDAKYKNADSITRIPAKLSEEVIEEIRNTAIRAFKAVHGKGLSRVDFFVDNDNNIYINEINTMPGFTTISMYPKLWEESGIKYSDLLDEVISLAE